ncbi:tetratricopeptide repeat protein, partial [uncultured Treponema sp.]|uniref:tetratricopeptide repeat protein n=1 Tax=uncultured Treponema sp. TaxID=162155 RepID=UPI0025968151
MSALDEIDALISQQQYKEALKELGKIEKKAYGSWPQLGVFRRYAQIGENARAEKVLVRALKSNPKNEELNAVYAHFLLRAGKLDQALEAGKCLQGTKYGSVYSEAVLQDTLEKSGN